MVRIDEGLEIPEAELRFRASRGGGPGGQHVNKVASRLTLRFDVRRSPSLNDEQRERVQRVLASRISRAGVLQLSSHASRSQAANREQLVRRFAALLRGALRRERARLPTRPGTSARARRLREKKARARLKRARGRVRLDQE